MKVLLLEDIELLGYFGDVVEVKTGYARNYLLPHALATIPTDVSVKAIAEEKAKRAEERKLLVEKMTDAQKAVEGAEVVIASKANEQGHLFGSVDEKQIAENLREQGFVVPDDIIRMESHIKEIGTHIVRLRYAEELTAKITVVVVSEDGVPEAALAAAKAEEEANAPAPVEQQANEQTDEIPADVPAFDDDTPDAEPAEDKPTEQ
ncbi:MAG: 50S ribosomal protein L9 [Planctomycetes bacterium]|nr:50S ribosomal protein L9 [Planctomycetota bacterium]